MEELLEIFDLWLEKEMATNGDKNYLMVSESKALAFRELLRRALEEDDKQ